MQCIRWDEVDGDVGQGDCDDGGDCDDAGDDSRCDYDLFFLSLIPCCSFLVSLFSPLAISCPLFACCVRSFLCYVLSFLSCCCFSVLLCFLFSFCDFASSLFLISVLLFFLLTSVSFFLCSLVWPFSVLAIPFLTYLCSLNSFFCVLSRLPILLFCLSSLLTA